MKSLHESIIIKPSECEVSKNLLTKLQKQGRLQDYCIGCSYVYRCEVRLAYLISFSLGDISFKSSYLHENFPV